CKQNKIPVRDVRVVRIGMIKGKESPAIGRRVIKTSRYPLAPDEDVRRLTRTMNTRFTSGEKIAVGEDGGRWTGGREDTRRGREKKREYKVVPPGEKTSVVFPSEVEEEDKRDRSQKTDREGESSTIRVASAERCAKRAKGEKNDRRGTRVISREKENGIKSHPLPTLPRLTRRTTSCDVYRTHKGPRPDLRPAERVPRSYPVPDAQSYGFALGTLLSDRAPGNRILKVLACTCKRSARGDSNDDRVEIRPVRSSWKERDERTYNLHKIKRDRVARQEEKLGKRKRERERERSS
ncbi:hypothetical protein ALC60_01821, partial [Trachymyrmex zeteki]